MTRRQRKFVGTIILIVFVCLYAMIAMALAQSRIADAPILWKTLWYVFLGLFWVVPALPLIKWMERPDPGEPPPQVLPK